MNLGALTPHAPEVWNLVSAVIGGVIGAAAGSVPAFVLARRERLAHQRAAVIKAFAKLETIANSLLSFQNQIDAMIRRAAEDGRESIPMHEKISAFVGISNQELVNFEAEDLSPFIEKREMEYVSDLQLLSRRHSASIASIQEYGNRKIELHNLLLEKGRITHHEDGTYSMAVARDTAPAFQARVQELEALITNVCADLRSNCELAQQLANQFGPIFTRNFRSRNLKGLGFQEAKPPPPSAPAASSHADRDSAS